MDWHTFSLLRACETTMRAAVPCRCGARDWRGTNPTSLRSLIARVFKIDRLNQIAFICAHCEDRIHVSRKEYLALARSIRGGVAASGAQ